MYSAIKEITEKDTLNYLKLKLIHSIAECESEKEIENILCTIMGHLWDYTKNPPMCNRCGAIKIN